MLGTPQPYNFKNRIINGAMAIAQRGTSFSGVTGNQYVTDRFQVQFSSSGTITSAQSSTAPAKFTNSWQQTVTATKTPGTSDYAVLTQTIEGTNFDDLGWGTADAQTVTISFWVRSSVTGTYSIFVRNPQAFSRSYVATYTVNSANTFEYKTITVAGDTTGAWAAGTSGALQLGWDLGSGSGFNTTAGSWQAGSYFRTTGTTNWISNSGATFFITGVQLEVGVTATGFDYRPYGTELALCQRYCQVLDNSSSQYGTVGYAIAFSSTYAVVNIPLVVSMRTAPSSVTISNNAHFQITNYNTTVAWSSFSLGSANCTPVNAEVEGTTGSGLTAGNAYVARGNNSFSGKLTFSAEL
jgi:hypothetical protein